MRVGPSQCRDKYCSEQRGFAPMCKTSVYEDQGQEVVGLLVSFACVKKKVGWKWGGRKKSWISGSVKTSKQRETGFGQRKKDKHQSTQMLFPSFREGIAIQISGPGVRPLPSSSCVLCTRSPLNIFHFSQVSPYFRSRFLKFRWNSCRMHHARQLLL